MGTPDTTGLLLPDKCLAGNSRIGNGRIDMGAYEYYERLELDLKVFLEGPYNGSNMNTGLTGMSDFPLFQPYDGNPWFYNGSENVPTIPGTDIVDWILVELRDALDAASATESTGFDKMAGFLLSDGSIVSEDGSSGLEFYNIMDEQLFTVIWHRNHLGVLSAFPLTETAGIYGYDFTTPAGQAYGTNAQKDLSGVYGLFAGDANLDGIIDEPDKTAWSNHVGQGGYLAEDFSLNGQVDNKDKNDIWIPNIGSESQVPE